MTFARSLSHSPHPYDVAMAADTVKGLDVTGELREFLSSVGGCSPYLKSLIQKEQDWLLPALVDGGDVISVEYDRLRALSYDHVSAGLRQAKRRIALYVALCDLGHVWPLEKVVSTLTDFADLSVTLALNAALGAELARGRIPGFDTDQDPQQMGYFVLAMGKMGAHELNYSSDIDLICLFDEARYDADDFFQARSRLIKATKSMSALLNDFTPDGYVFRTDLRLRPDPAVTPVCMGIDAAERYYESLGRTWERAAYIKARVCAGDQTTGQRFLKNMAPFVWRKHLDFAAIEDAHRLRLRYREHKGTGGPITLSGHNMKLGRGGIREIEFFTQTRQLIAGGRDPSLRCRGTLEGLDRLADQDWIDRDTAMRLSDHYRAHRTVEHRLQMINDAQTHDLPQTDDGFERLAALMGQSTADLRSNLRERLEDVHHTTEGFFTPSNPTVTTDANPQEAEIITRWPSYAALRSERAEAIFDRLRPEILTRLRNAAKPDEALLSFDRFLKGLPAGVQLFSLFQSNAQLIDLLIDVIGTAPALAAYLSRNAQVLDAVIGGSFWDPWPSIDTLAADLTMRLTREGDYEHKLDGTRRWGKEWHFRIGVHLLRGIIDAQTASRQYADLAQAMLQGLWPEVMSEFARKHGPAPGRGAVVLGMGSLGAGRLHANSDLDMIVIYDAQGIDISDGKRPLNARTYYARLTQALITAMTAPMAEGRLYEVDMRLRPSGNKGPVATSWDAFQSYQQNEAWIWEHLALSRARVVAGPSALARDVERLRAGLMGGRDADHVGQALLKMRARIAAVKGDDDPWQIKVGAGRLQDIELFSQMGALIAGSDQRDVASGLRCAKDIGVITDADRTELEATYDLFWRLQVASRLLSENRMNPAETGAAGQEFLLRLVGCRDLTELEAKMIQQAHISQAIIDRALPEPKEDTDER